MVNTHIVVKEMIWQSLTYSVFSYIFNKQNIFHNEAMEYNINLINRAKHYNFIEKMFN